VAEAAGEKINIFDSYVVTDALLHDTVSSAEAFYHC
jgi:hypothetical protein